MSPQGAVPPKYNPELVERAILEVVIDLHPASLTMAELSSTIAGDLGDPREVETIADAIRNLRRSDLLRNRGDDRVAPTQAALRAAALLLG